MGNQMIPEINKLLFTTDLSENADYAFGYAASIANHHGAGIVFLLVLEDVTSSDHLILNIMGYEKWRELKKENEQQVLDSVKERLEKFCADISSELPACPFITDEIVTKIGDPVEEILKVAETKACDMIVMGSKGHGNQRDFLIGSTAGRVMSLSKKPVLTIPLPK